MNDAEKLCEIRQLIQSWLNKQSHDRCWYYPEIFVEIASVLDISTTVDRNLPPRQEFEKGCKRYQDGEYLI